MSCIPGLPWNTAEVSQAFGRSEGYYQSVIEEQERSIIVKALIKNRGNKAKTARMLNMQRSVLYKKIKRLKIDAELL
ncbi:DNA-binding NtrC family response regulator [Sporomusaceae bacterium BoRhaA]|uniref:helix-turn-helix domain-containing protein n=1 Tax=Pelorhabdus rhamnosifermentans TaxID=2772457 RepID=UPI001C060051|nr:helix-turn-helix domain-containing protein [Pelorhabdus rhamnosifermentans]MBU2700103.1 DNA-binding NtrC family response regulator [Pelorhabdus rhamnosifermentans]